MIPVMRRLMKKGMPLYIAITFIVAGPILNPIVFASTFMAFRHLGQNQLPDNEIMALKPKLIERIEEPTSPYVYPNYDF